MAQIAVIQQCRPEYSENLLPIMEDRTLTITSGMANGTVNYNNNFHFDEGSSIKMDITSSGLNKFINFNLSDYSVTAPKTANYIFSYRLKKVNPTDSIDFAVEIFVNGILSTDTTYDNNLAVNGDWTNLHWNTFAQSISLNAGDVLTFRFIMNTDLLITSLYLDGLKLELDDRFLGVPSIYSKPKDYNELTTNIIFVNSLSDLPTPSAGVITLQANKTYYITSLIDLLGNRLVGGANTTIIGASSEVSILTSTGLGGGIALLSSIYTTPIRHIAINDVHTAVNFDGTSNPNDMALDWTGVNFVNVPSIGIIREASNFVFDKGAFLNSKGLVFDGTIGTVALNNSLFSGDGLAGNILQLLSTCTITRRFRVIYSSIVATSSNVGINVNASASIPVESYILDTVNFSGGATYLSGVSVTDNKTLFVNCKGISNTNEVSQYYMNGNATTTTIASIGVAVKVNGTTTSAGITQKFTNTNNRATYVGSLTRFFKVTATLSLESGVNNQVGCYIAKNGTVLNESEVYGTTSGAGRAENIVIQTLVELSTNDYIEIFVENATAVNNILVTELNVITE